TRFSRDWSSDVCSSDLAALAGELQAARAALIPPTADMIAEAACTVIATWTETAPRTELFVPLIRAWISAVQGATVVQVHPSDIRSEERRGRAQCLLLGE